MMCAAIGAIVRGVDMAGQPVVYARSTSRPMTGAGEAPSYIANRLGSAARHCPIMARCIVLMILLRVPRSRSDASSPGFNREHPGEILSASPIHSSLVARPVSCWLIASTVRYGSRRRPTTPPIDRRRRSRLGQWSTVTLLCPLPRHFSMSVSNSRVTMACPSTK